MISKNKIKYIRSLELKKNRNKEGKFVAEGFKVVDDLLALQPADLIVATQEWLHGKHLADQTEVIAVGTIIRIADWFGITHIYCIQDTADVYNPKVVQATMGSIARVKVEYGNLLALVESLPADVRVYGTLLDGDNIYQQQLRLPLPRR